MASSQTITPSQTRAVLRSDGILLEREHLGRNAAVNEIIDLARSRQYVVLGSPPATGKTSLLQLVQKKLRSQGATVKRLPLTGFLTIEEVKTKINQLGLSADEDDMKNVVNTWLLLDDAQDFSGFGYFVWDMVSDELDWSAGLFKIFGVNQEEFTPSLQGFLDAVLEEDRDSIQQAIQSAVENGGSFLCEERIHRPGGEIRYLESRGRLVVDDCGKPQRLVGLCHDVTENKTQYDSLREQVNGLELLAEFSAHLHSGSIVRLQWTH